MLSKIRINRSFINLVSLVILNCLGSGLIMLPPRLAKLGVSCFLSWILTGLGAFGIGMIFVRLGEELKGSNYYLHNLISFKFKGTMEEWIKSVVFWGYWLFLVLGNAALSITVISSMSYFWPEFCRNYAMHMHIFIFTSLFIINRFGIGLSRRVSIILAIIKILIMVVFPVCCIFLLPVNPLPLAQGNSSILQNIASGMFLTLWPFVGIETIIMEDNVDLKMIRPAMISGILICTATYILNTYVMMTNVPNLANSSSAYADLFGVAFGNQAQWVGARAQLFVNLPIILIIIGSLHGWTNTTLSTCKSGLTMFPKFLQKLNRYSVPERALLISSIIPVLFIFVLEFMLKDPNLFGAIIDIVSAVCLIIYLLGAVAFARIYLNKPYLNKLFGEDLIYLILGSFYIIIAFIGSPMYANYLAVLLFAILIVIFYLNGLKTKSGKIRSNKINSD